MTHVLRAIRDVESYGDIFFQLTKVRSGLGYKRSNSKFFTKTYVYVHVCLRFLKRYFDEGLIEIKRHVFK